MYSISVCVERKEGMWIWDAVRIVTECDKYKMV